nr:rod shape-determining protein MreC [Flavonifractor sp. AGMB03687]
MDTGVKDFFRHNGILILIAAILLALVTAVVSMLLGGKANPLANLVGIVTTPVRNGISAVTNWAEERYSDAFEQEQMKEELEALKQENAELKAKEREYEAAIQENQRLYNLLELTPKDKQFTKEAAMVTARSTSNWESTLTLSKGTNQGIAVDNCVVDEYWNLVGVVAEVGENWCTVRTLIDANMELGGQLVRTGGAAILEGDLALMEEGKLKLTYLPENSQLMSGDLVTTSGRGGVYPSGLVAGHVEEVRTDASGMTDYAVIVPETDLDNLQQVFVIKDFTIVE